MAKAKVAGSMSKNPCSIKPKMVKPRTAIDLRIRLGSLIFQSSRQSSLCKIALFQH